MTQGHWILKGKKCVKCDLMTWAKFIENGDRSRIIQQTKIQGILVSTVFLGIDHNFGNGPPSLFETMVFGGAMDEHQERYPTWRKAYNNHWVLVGFAAEPLLNSVGIDGGVRRMKQKRHGTKGWILGIGKDKKYHINLMALAKTIYGNTFKLFIMPRKSGYNVCIGGNLSNGLEKIANLAIAYSYQKWIKDKQG